MKYDWQQTDWCHGVSFLQHLPWTDLSVYSHSYYDAHIQAATVILVAHITVFKCCIE